MCYLLRPHDVWWEQPLERVDLRASPTWVCLLNLQFSERSVWNVLLHSCSRIHSFTSVHDSISEVTFDYFLEIPAVSAGARGVDCTNTHPGRQTFTYVVCSKSYIQSQVITFENQTSMCGVQAPCLVILKQHRVFFLWCAYGIVGLQLNWQTSLTILTVTDHSVLRMYSYWHWLRNQVIDEFYTTRCCLVRRDISFPVTHRSRTKDKQT